MEIENVSELIHGKIYLIRGKKVMLDRDLAKLYGVEVKRLNEVVKRNFNRFPKDFMFQINEYEVAILRSQIATSKIRAAEKRGGRRYLPYAFTEQGVAMLSGVLRSKRAIEVNITIMRTFVKLRQIISTHKELNDRLFELEKKYDEKFRVVFDAIRELMKEDNDDQIGFDLN